MALPLFSLADEAVDIYTAPLPQPHATTTRRQNEIAATAMLLSELFGPEAAIAHTPEGAPMVTTCGAATSAAISISHSRDTLAIAVSKNGHPVGIDIESPRANLQRVAPRFLRGEEMPVHGFSITALLKAWTAKEAAFKALGIKGLMLYDILLDESCTTASAPNHPGAPAAAIHHHCLPDGSMIAVATKAKPTS